jgi:hypothetical protein
MDGHGSGDMTNRDLICLGETMSKRLARKDLKANTISWIFTSWNGLKRQACVCTCREPLLESLRTVNITGVRIDKQEWLDLRHPGDDAANGNELSEMHAFDFAYGHRDVRV